MHGRLPADEKEDAMTAFRAGQIDVLVCTTVIEVGVDVPNATVMLVLDADRFGISQLHQLRGRIGRGQHPSLCLLETWSSEGSQAGRRLKAVAATMDGFALADLDLKERKEGDVLGRNQSGRAITLRLLSLADHLELIEAAREFCLAAYEENPANPTWPWWQRLSPTQTASNTWTSRETPDVMVAGRRRGARPGRRLSDVGIVGGPACRRIRRPRRRSHGGARRRCAGGHCRGPDATAPL